MINRKDRKVVFEEGDGIHIFCCGDGLILEDTNNFREHIFLRLYADRVSELYGKLRKAREGEGFEFNRVSFEFQRMDAIDEMTDRMVEWMVGFTKEYEKLAEWLRENWKQI